MLKYDLIGDDNLVPKMVLALQCNNDYIAGIIIRRASFHEIEFVGRGYCAYVHGEGSLFGGLVIELPCTSEQSG